MPKRKKNKEINVFGVSFMDVLSNTVGGLAFLLIIVFLLIGRECPPIKKPQILTETIPDAHIRKPYDFTFSARDADGVYFWEVVKGELPEGLKLDAQSGRVNGTIQRKERLLTPEMIEFVVGCTGINQCDENDRKTDFHTYKMVLHPAVKVPAVPVKITSEPELPPAVPSEKFPLTLSCTGGAPPYKWTVEKGKLPQGLKLDKNGSFTGAAAQVGDYTFTALVTAGSKSTATKDTRQFLLKVIDKRDPPPPPPPLKILTESVPDVVVDHQFSLFPAAEGGYPPYQWRIVSGKPRWMQSGNEAKSFTGKPGHKDLGEYGIVIEVSDSKNETVKTPKMVFKVVPQGMVPDPLDLLTDSMPPAVQGEVLSFYPAAKGGYMPLEWQCRGIEKQAGLTFDPATGHISGTPDAVGTASLRFTVTDAAGNKDSADLEMKVTAPDVPLHLISVSVPLGLAQLPYQTALSASGGKPPYKWSLAKGDLPKGMALDPDTGVLKGTPETPGDYTFTPKVSDTLGTTRTAPKPIVFKVWSRKQRPKLVMKTTSVPLMVQGQFMSLALAAEGGLPPYQWEIKGNLPKGMECDDGILSGTPGETGRFPVVLSLTDAEGQAVETEIGLAVEKLWPWWWILVCIIAALVCLLLAWRALRRPPLTKVRIVTDQIPNARASCEYSVWLACEGGCGPYQWEVVEGELPPGLSLSTQGQISGTPFERTKVNETVETRFTIQVKDSRGQKDKKEL